MNDTYQTIKGAASGEFRDRGSKFLAYAYPLAAAGGWQELLEALKREHPKARHHCYAYRWGTDGNNFRANDDGEPSGTAGRPILGQIDSFGLTNVVVIVVRYFGGTKLGTSGLINAYRTSAAAALANAEIMVKTINDIYLLTFGYDQMGAVMSAIEKTGVEMLSKDFGERASIHVSIRQGDVPSVLTALKAWIAGVSLSEGATIDQLDGVDIHYQYTR